jgi:galactarate dehydratase
MEKPITIRMSERDNVAIVANDGGLPAGTQLSGLTLREHVPQGHKVALVDLPEGAPVLRYNVAIGQTVQCVAGVTEFAVQRIRQELLPKSPNVDDVVALEHTYGCGVAIDAPDAIVPIRTLRNISLNPNFGGEVMVISLGCEKLQPQRLMPPGTIPLVDERSIADVGDNAEAGLDVVCLQDDRHVGFMSMIDSIVTQAEEHLERLNARRRETVPASELVVGVQCGGSDAFSGVTANPAVGYCTDLLVRAGATVMFSEVTEVRDGIDQLTSRAASPEVAVAMIREMAWYDRYLDEGGVDRSANTTPGNKKGGLANIVEKAMGSIVKSGTSPISGVLSPGEKVGRKGLIYAATPASDFICGTLQLAAGMTVHVFTSIGNCLTRWFFSTPRLSPEQSPEAHWRRRRALNDTRCAHQIQSFSDRRRPLRRLCSTLALSASPSWDKLIPMIPGRRWTRRAVPGSPRSAVLASWSSPSPATKIFGCC